MRKLTLSTDKNEHEVIENRYYLVDFASDISHVIQVYSHMATPVRWNSKDSERRKMIFKVVKGSKEESSFITMMKRLAYEQKRSLKMNPVRDLFCKDCGVQYEYEQSTGIKFCVHCGCKNFISPP